MTTSSPTSGNGLKRRRNQPEKRTERAIINGLRTLGFRVTKTSQPRRTMMTLGTPDLYATHSRWKVRTWIEVKHEGRRREKNGGLSFDQICWIRDEREAGGCVIVAYSLADVISELKKLGAPIE